MKALFFVCAGGAVGSGGRYLLTLAAHRFWGGGFPFGTFSVNVLGSFLLGALLTAWPVHPDETTHLRLALGTGVLGGFTTYSTFNYETVQLFSIGSAKLGALYVGATLASCVLAGLLGVIAASMNLVTVPSITSSAR